MATGYRELAAVLRDEIHDGKYAPGATLPKQNEIAQQYDVNVNTVRKAVGVLEAEGLVTPVRRKGTVVRARPPMNRLGTDRYAKSKWKFGLVAFAADREASGQTWKLTLHIPRPDADTGRSRRTRTSRRRAGHGVAPDDVHRRRRARRVRPRYPLRVTLLLDVYLQDSRLAPRYVRACHRPRDVAGVNPTRRTDALALPPP